MGINMVEDAHAFPCISIGFCSVPTKHIARIIPGVGMGGESPLASSHSAESSEDAGDGARNVALLYLFGSGGGQALCPLVTYLMDVSGVPEHLLWRWIFAVGSILPVGQHIAALWFTFATFVVGKCRKL
jgi:MFS family permease